MNVIYILADQHNPAFAGCYGGITRTPHLDALASTGVRFQNTYTNSPLCAPARASMFTGRYVHEIGFWDNATPYDGRLPNWARYFAKCGAQMVTIGKLDFQTGVDHGIEVMKNVKLRHNIDVTGLFRDGPPIARESHMRTHWGAAPRTETDTRVTQKEEAITLDALHWLEHERPSDRPWLLNVNYFKPHPGWYPDAELYEYYLDKIAPLSGRYLQPWDELGEPEKAQSLWSCGYAGDESRIPEIHAAYHASVEEVDNHVGRILATLDELGLRDDTLILYTSDHGEMARAHGCWGKISLYEDAIRVPLIINGPGLPSGAVESTPVSLIDVYPTICDALGLKAPTFARGQSLLGVARGEEKDAPFVFTESHANPRIAGSFAVISGGWKLIEVVGHDPLLFHLYADPDEMHNLGTSQGGEERTKLAELRGILHSICDPEMVDASARAGQKRRLEELAETGQLFHEQQNRSFKADRNQLIPAD